MARDAALIEALRARGPAPARELLARLRISQPTLCRAVRAAGARVCAIGSRRFPLYAARREVRTLGDSWSVYRLDERGRASVTARLHALHTRHWWWERIEPDRPLGDGEPETSEDLPWFLEDLRPQGFMGHAFARAHAPALGLPPDPRVWTAEQLLVALLSEGHDLPGDLVLGESALARAQRPSSAPIPASGRTERYEALAAAALAGEPAGSSAAGEQPKFTAAVADRRGIRQVIVKLSPPRSTAAGRRWADLLCCEHLATGCLREHGIAASTTEWIEGSRRAFLEITRFDRIEARGRAPLVSLHALDAHAHGKLDDWSSAAGRLVADGWLDEADAARLRTLHAFGRLVANTDMHFGNACLHAERRPFRLAPAYDMLPMAYQPAPTGEVPPRSPGLDVPPPEAHAAFRRALPLALDFWARVAADPRISAPFRKLVRDRPRVIAEVAGLIG